MKDFFSGIDHPALAAEDVSVLSRWYCEVLGYTVFAKTDKLIYVLKAPDGSFIELMPKDETTRPDRTVCTPGWSHLALRVNDMDKAIKALNNHNVNWCGEEFEAVGGGRIRNFIDPEGNLLQIVERN